MENPEQEQPIRKDSNKIYFLIAVILVLAGTNTYLYLKDKKANDQIVTISDEKTRMQTEIDKIEAELDNATSDNLKLSEEMQNEQEIARDKINELRNALKKGELTQGQLDKAQSEIKQLKYFVTKYTSEIDKLKKLNENLINERDELISTVDSVSTKASQLERQNEELNTKVLAAAALKTGNISVIAYNIKNSGKESTVTRANTVDKLKISFSVINNSIAKHGIHNIFLRVIDPSGNLIITNNGGLFVSENEELQYSYKTAIEFGNDGRNYSIDWTNSASYQKGVYTVLLYADGYTMGKGTISLR